MPQSTQTTQTMQSNEPLSILEQRRNMIASERNSGYMRGVEVKYANKSTKRKITGADSFMSQFDTEPAAPTPSPSTTTAKPKDAYAGQTISQAPQMDILGKAKDWLTSVLTESKSKSANVYALSKVYNVPLSDVEKNYQSYIEKTGVSTQPTGTQFIKTAGKAAMVPLGITAAAANPIGAGLAAAGFAAIDETENYIISKNLNEKYQLGAGKTISDVLPNDYSSAVKDVVDIAEFAGKMLGASYGAMKVSPKAWDAFHNFVTTTTESYSLPQKVFINAEKVKSIFQTGENISPAESDMVKSLGLTATQYKQAIKDGIEIETPMSKIIEIADKPYWANVKQAIGLKPYRARFEGPVGDIKVDTKLKLEGPGGKYAQEARGTAQAGSTQEGVVQGETERLRLRDNAQNGMEAQAGEVASGAIPKTAESISVDTEQAKLINEAVDRVNKWNDAEKAFPKDAITKEVDLSSVLGKQTRPLVQPIDIATPYEPSLFVSGEGKLTDPIPLKAVNINLQKIGSSDDVKSVIDQVGKLYTPQIQEARRGTITNEQAQALADDINMPIEKLMSRMQGEAFNAENIIAARQVLVSSAENLHTLAQVAARTDASDIDRLAFRKALATHAAIQMQVSGLTAEAGRALNAFRITAQGKDSITRQIKDLLESSGGNDVTDQMINDIASLDDVRSINTYAAKTYQASLLDMLLEARYAAMLSSPKTHIINAVGNALFTTWQIPERMLAAGFSKLLNNGEGVYLGEAEQMAFGLMQGIKEGWAMAGKAMRTGESPSPLSDKAEFIRNQRAITGENFFALKGLRELSEAFPDVASFIGRGIDFIGEYVTGGPTRALMSADAFFKGVAGRMELNAQAYRIAQQENLTGDAAAARIQEVKHNPPEDILLRAVAFADYVTFTDKLDSSLGKSVSSTISRNPWLKIIVPFVKTPLNIFYRSAERSPFAVAMKSFRSDIAAGGAKRDLALARLSMGSLLMAGIWQLCDEGSVTGGGPSDPALMRTNRTTGWQPYSIKIGDKYYGYNRLEPMSSLIGLAADLHEISGEAQAVDEDQYLTATQASLLALIKNVSSKTYLQGLTDLFEVASDPDRYGPQYVRSLTTSFIPAVSGAIAKAEDPEVKDIRNMVDALKAKIPGYSEQVPARRNVWGDKIMLTGGITAEMISPIYTTSDKKDPASDEIWRLRLPLSMPQRKIMDIDLDPKQYERYCELSGNAAKDGSGNGFHDAVNELIKTDDYKSMTDELKSEYIKSYQHAYRSAAQAQMLEEFPDLYDKIQTAQEKKYEAMTR